MADSPIWVQLAVPVITAASGWAFSYFDLPTIGGASEYAGTWYAYYRCPDGAREIEQEQWAFTKLGRVSVSREGKTTFKGRIVVKGAKAYMSVSSVRNRGRERLLVMLEPPNNPRSSLEKPSICLWLGMDGDSRITSGHALLSRKELTGISIKDEFIRAGS